MSSQSSRPGSCDGARRHGVREGAPSGTLHPARRLGLRSATWTTARQSQFRLPGTPSTSNGRWKARWSIRSRR